MSKVYRIAIVLSCALLSSVATAQDIYLEGGWLVDPRARTVSKGNLLIVDGVISGRPAAPPEGFDGEVRDARDLWIIPGLRDLHTHSMVNGKPQGPPVLIGTAAAATRMLYCGVTGFLDLFNSEDFVLPLRDRQRTTDQVPGADIFAAGPCFTATDGHCTEYGVPTRVIDTPEEARREVAELAAKKPDVVKIVYEHVDEELRGKTWRTTRPTLDKPTLEAVLAAAAEHGLTSVVHIRSWADIRDAVQAGADAVTHLPTYGLPPEDVLKLMHDKGAVMIPTLAISDAILITEPKIFEDGLTRAMAEPSIREAYGKIDPSAENMRPMIEGFADAQKYQFESLRKLVKANVKIVAGTDSGNPRTLHGYSLHRELALMVEGGLTPWQSLATATTEAGDFLGRSWGLDDGDEGSVVLLGASPIDDIRNSEKIAGVIHHGRWVDRAKLLAEEPAPPRPPGPPRSPAASGGRTN